MKLGMKPGSGKDKSPRRTSCLDPCKMVGRHSCGIQTPVVAPPVGHYSSSLTLRHSVSPSNFIRPLLIYMAATFHSLVRTLLPIQLHLCTPPPLIRTGYLPLAPFKAFRAMLFIAVLYLLTYRDGTTEKDLEGPHGSHRSRTN